jgi:hypothetical protein
MFVAIYAFLVLGSAVGKMVKVTASRAVKIFCSAAGCRVVTQPLAFYTSGYIVVSFIQNFLKAYIEVVISKEFKYCSPGQLNNPVLQTVSLRSDLPPKIQLDIVKGWEAGQEDTFKVCFICVWQKIKNDNFGEVGTLVFNSQIGS